MRKFVIIVLCIVAVIGSGIAWCKFNYPAYTYRYRMTVEVAVDGTVHSGSSVIEVVEQYQGTFLQTPPFSTRVRGEGVFVDLGNGRNVIAMLASGPNGRNIDYPHQIVPLLFGITQFSDFSKLPELRGRREIPEKTLPTFVTFTDLNNPETARVVLPGEFARVFGPGVRLQGIRIEMTTEPITDSIERKFPWWNGPFPWLKPLGGGTYVDTRSDVFRWQKEMFKRSS